MQPATPPVPVPSKVPRLGDSALRYMASLYDPRSVKEANWVPQNAALSQKTLVFTRGTFSTGTSGLGYVCATPQPFNDIASVTSTTVSSAGGPGTILASVTNTQSAAPNGPFASTQIGPNTGGSAGLLSWRVVSQAIYVRFAGTELNRGGDMLLFEEPQHGDVLQYSFNTALSIDGVKRVKVSSDWQHVSWNPTVYQPNSVSGSAQDETAWSNSPTQPARRNLAIVVQSAAWPQPFDYEVYSWVEFVGSLARSPSISFNDPIGFNAIVGASQMYQQLDSVLGMEGFVRAVEAQLANQSIPASLPPHGNFVGLLPFLPKLAEMVGPVLKGALKGGMMAALPREMRQVVKAEKARKTLAKPRNKAK